MKNNVLMVFFNQTEVSDQREMTPRYCSGSSRERTPSDGPDLLVLIGLLSPQVPAVTWNCSSRWTP